jgi:hypothetical protein
LVGCNQRGTRPSPPHGSRMRTFFSRPWPVRVNLPVVWSHHSDPPSSAQRPGDVARAGRPGGPVGGGPQAKCDAAEHARSHRLGPVVGVPPCPPIPAGEFRPVPRVDGGTLLLSLDAHPDSAEVRGDGVQRVRAPPVAVHLTLGDKETRYNRGTGPSAAINVPLRSTVTYRLAWLRWWLALRRRVVACFVLRQSSRRGTCWDSTYSSWCASWSAGY